MKRFTVKASKNSSFKTKSRRITAALDDEFDNYEDDLDQNFGDTLDDLSDAVEDIQDTVDDIKEDEENIEVDNNITGHYIAECEKCRNIFISATVESDQKVTKVTGTCPICGEETDQYLKWIIRDVDTGYSEPDYDTYMHNQRD